MGINQASAAYISTNGVFSSWENVSWDSAPTVLANIQDVKVLVSSYEPEYGKAMGAVLNVTTKSGTKDFHGSLWYAFSPPVAGHHPDSPAEPGLPGLSWLPAPGGAIYMIMVVTVFAMS